YKCVDCLGACLVCQACMVEMHTSNPLHCVKQWMGNFFEKTTLKKLGMQIQLGHPSGVTCTKPTPLFADDFVVIDCHGIHEVNLDFCDCITAQRNIKELLRCSLFPGSTDDPRTAATFSVLNQYLKLLYESKVSAYKFYQLLAQQTSNTGVKESRVCHPPSLMQ
ncbi:hypothetical protein CONPUDRAFT_54582, partial [Coniophora puteana RWD-64-598 SS2]